MPHAFVFALILTLLVAAAAFLFTSSTPLEIIASWYDGFWSLLEFGMQIVLLIITGYSIALSPIIGRAIDSLATYINSPKQVYFFVVLLGILLSMVSFGWVIITAVLARELAARVKGVHYPFLIACVYFSMNSWVTGLSSSIPLLLNTDSNYLIESGILSETISSSVTIGSSLNIAMIGLFLLFAPLMILFLAPKKSNKLEIEDLKMEMESKTEPSIREEADGSKLGSKSFSDSLNNTAILQMIIAAMGLFYIINHFKENGFDLNFNIMIFIFLILGLLIHKTPMRYAISMKRSSSNISGVLFQYPFYAGIMGIMLNTGLGEQLANFLSSFANANNYAFFAYLTGGIVNFAIPSAGGEFAVVGPSMLQSVQDISSGLSQEEASYMISRASMSIAYGESLSNLLQPFFLLLVIPVMGKGVKIQARDVMGYLIIPFITFFVLQSILVVFWPV